MDFPPALELFEYQERWLDDPAQFKIYAKSRQIGISFVEALDVAERLAAVPQTSWFYLSIKQDRANEAIAYMAKHCEAIGYATKIATEPNPFHEAEHLSRILRLPNGSFAWGLPANPTTARGASGNVTLDEFAHQKAAAEIWRAVSPITLWGYHLHVISSPNGKQGPYYDRWTNGGLYDVEHLAQLARNGEPLPSEDGWSRHWTDIHMAHAAGHPVDIEMVRNTLCRTEDDWLQEFCCAFLDEATAWLPFELIDGQMQLAQRYGAAMHWGDWDPRRGIAGPLYGGYDVGRFHHPSCLYLLERGRIAYPTRKVEMLRNTSFEMQRKIVFEAIEKCSKFAIDATGIGAQLAEEAVKRFGANRVIAYKFTAESKAKLAASGKRALEQGLTILPNDPELRDDFHSIQRSYATSGQVHFGAPSGGREHGDRFWAYCLALRALEQGTPRFRRQDYQRVEDRSRYEQTRDEVRAEQALQDARAAGARVDPSDRRRGRSWRDTGY